METKAMFFFRLLLVVLLTMAVGGSLPLTLLGEGVGEGLEGQASTGKANGESGQPLEPEIDLPQWSGLTKIKWMPEFYYEVNPGIYLGRSKDEGFLISYNNGMSWEQKNEGLPKK